jgi:hypothetical protein
LSVTTSSTTTQPTKERRAIKNQHKHNVMHDDDIIRRTE